MNQPWPTKGLKRLRAAKRVLDRIGDQLIAERKAAALREHSYGVEEKSDTPGKDLLTLLVRANMKDLDRMSDSDVRARKESPLFSFPLGVTGVPSRNWYFHSHRS